MLNKLSSKEIQFNGKKTGKFNVNSCMAPEILRLKIGARVMIIVNNFSEGYVNGTVGVVEDFNNNSIKLLTEDSKVVSVERYKFEEIGYTMKDGKLTHEVVGTFEQFPIMLAWGITIHKSQGKTLNRFNIDLSGGAFASGQFYVALSRATELNGVHLVKQAQLSDVKVSPDVVEFDKLEDKIYGFNSFMNEEF